VQGRERAAMLVFGYSRMAWRDDLPYKENQGKKKNKKVKNE
jgi:hypothetical protein